MSRPTAAQVLHVTLTVLGTGAISLFLAACLLAGQHLPIGESIGIATPLCLAGAAILSWRHRRLFSSANLQARPPATWALAAALTAGWCAGAAHRLWSPVWGWLVSTGGGDAGDHVFYATRLPRDGAQLYNGLISFHLYAWTLQRFTGMSWHETFAILSVGTVALLIAALAVLGARLGAGLPILLYGVLSFFVVAAVGDKILLPIIHVMQGEGFYPQLWGLLPFAGCWLAYAAGRDALERILAIALGVVIYRFTYGLNLTELILAGAVLAAIDVEAALKGPVRYLGATVAVAGGGAAGWIVAGTLFQLLAKGGATILTEPRLVALGTAALALGLLLDRFSADRTSLRARSALFCALLGGFAAAEQGALIMHGQKTIYYFVKLGLHPLWLLAAASAIHAPGMILSVLPSARKDRPSRAAALAGVALVTFGLSAASAGVAAYRPGYRERSTKLTASTHLVTLFEPGAYARIVEVLARNHESFGGYITRPLWPLSGFMNASLGFAHHFRQPFYKTGAVRPSPGNCVFWDSSPEDLAALHSLTSTKGVAMIEAIEKDGNVEHVPYTGVMSHEAHELSYRCYPPEEGSGDTHRAAP